MTCPSINYTKLAATANRLLGLNGKSVTIVRTAKGTYDPAAGETTGDTNQNIVGNAVFVNFKNSEIDGKNILSSDKKMIFSGVELLVDDRYLTGRVHAVTPIDPDESGDLSIYICQLRK